MRHAGHPRGHCPQRNSTSHSLSTPPPEPHEPKTSTCAFFFRGEIAHLVGDGPSGGMPDVARWIPSGASPSRAPSRYSLSTPKNLTDQKPPPPSPCAPKHPTWWVAMAHLRPLLAVPPPKWPVVGMPRGVPQKKAAAERFLCCTTPARTKHPILCSKCTPNRHTIGRVCATCWVLGVNVGPL